MEDITSFAFAGIFSMLILSMTFIFLLSIRLYQLGKKLEEIEDVVNITREELDQIIFRLNKLKPLIEGGSSE
jgi:hypothetical protein